MAAALIKREVAASFILKFPDGDERKTPWVALFKRSDRVRTYQHKLAPISGTVDASDPSPLATAWRELSEETTLTAPSLRLLRQGKPYTFTDDALGRQWTIHPFAFLLAAASPPAAEASITLDWEHSGYQWVSVADAAGGRVDGVPRLAESLRRVWFEVDAGVGAAAGVLGEGLRALRDDHESGARQLAGTALEVFTNVVPGLDGSGGREEWWRAARMAGWHLWKNGRESMGAPILSVVLACLGAVQTRLSTISENEPITKSFIDGVVGDMRVLAKARLDAAARLSANFVTFAQSLAQKHQPSPLRILTLSASGTITAALTHLVQSSAAPLTIDIRVLESRPLFEGVATARKIAAALSNAGGVTGAVTVYADAGAAVAARGIHLLLLGADLIDAGGAVSNKAGSLPAVLAARHVSPGVKVAVLSETDKVLPFEPPGHGEENDTSEVTAAWALHGRDAGEEVSVKNVYFEWVPADMVDAYVTEEMIASREDMATRAKLGLQQASSFFDDL